MEYRRRSWWQLRCDLRTRNMGLSEAFVALFNPKSTTPTPRYWMVWLNRLLVFRLFCALGSLLAKVFAILMFQFVLRSLLPRRVWMRYARSVHKLGGFQDTPIQIENWEETLGSWPCLYALCAHDFGEAWAGYVTMGGPAPNPEVVLLKGDNGSASCRILDFMREGRPLVLNFGNCS